MSRDANEAIHRRTDGSIDPDFYLARGRVERSHQAQHTIGLVGQLAGRIWLNLGRHLKAFGPTSGFRRRKRTGLI